MDLSDGLSTDLPRLCAASHVGARLNASALPVVRVSKRNGAKTIDASALALNGGDDYELVFTVRPSKTRQLPRTFQGIPLTAVGEIARGHAVKLVQSDGREQPLSPGGWDPFKTVARGSLGFLDLEKLLPGRRRRTE
jgi:thiamine-monophosphate kinase